LQESVNPAALGPCAFGYGATRKETCPQNLFGFGAVLSRDHRATDFASETVSLGACSLQHVILWSQTAIPLCEGRSNFSRSKGRKIRWQTWTNWQM